MEDSQKIYEMQRFAVIPAAGRFTRHRFDKPRALLSLNSETILGRLLRQLGDIKPIVGVGEPGVYGWTDDHLAEFEKLPCRIVRSPFSRNIGALRTALFLLQFLSDNFSIEPTAKIYWIPGDSVFTDQLFEEMLAYPAPTTWVYKWGEPGVTITGEILPLILGVEHVACYTPNFIGMNCKSFLPKLINKPKQFTGDHTGNFMEIDTLNDYQEAIKLVRGDKK